LMLAWLALLFAMAVHVALPARTTVRLPMLLVAAPLWLLFVPNAPYVATDIVNLRVSPSVPFWYDALMMAVFVSTGLSLGLLSIYLMQEAVRHIAGLVVSWVFVLWTFVGCSVGIYLGRVLRRNSWDAIFAPDAVLADVWAIVRHPYSHQQAWGVIVLFSAFLAASYVTFYASTRLRIVDRSSGSGRGLQHLDADR